METLGPNTNAPPNLLSPRCILVAGEDRRNLLYLLPSQENASHAFRGYEFWKQPEFTLILCGIGTGCLEPLIWELTRPGIVRELVLIGTAGKMPNASVEVGQPYAVIQAFLAGTGLDGEPLDETLTPCWPLPPTIPAASSVSTDFFYGFGPRLLTGEYPFADGALRERYLDHCRRGTSLVEMEVAQFYAFCRAFGGKGLRYLAIKGVSNELGDDARQIAESRTVITRCMEMARGLMGI